MAGERQGFKRGAHSRGAGLAHDRLRALGGQMREGPRLGLGRPSIGWPAGRRWGRGIAVLVIVAVVVFVAVQWLRPVPAPTFHGVPASALRLPGTPPTLPWPSTGAAALSEVGVGSLGQSGTAGPVPIASLAKVMVAYVVLKDHPLAVGDQGPAIPVNQAVVSEAQSGLASQQSELAVTAGESLSELQALQGLLLIGANDMATLLAGWDAGSTAAFVQKMNTVAKTLKLSSVHITDPSGLDPATVGSAADMVSLGQAAMANPVFAQVVGMKQASEPGAGTIFNLDNALGHDGIVGIKTGNSTQAGGCFLFEATQSVGGQPVTLLGVVLGQQGTPTIATAINAGEGLLAAAFGTMRAVPLVTPGTTVGRLSAPWGSSVGVTTSGGPTIVSAPGLALHARIHITSLPSSLTAGERVGTLEVLSPGRTVDVPLVTAGALSGPSVWWHFTR